MRTVINLDDRLLKRVQTITGLKKKVDAVNFALAEVAKRENRKSILALEGKIKWQDDPRTFRDWH